jgi:hypothetical protein
MHSWFIECGCESIKGSQSGVRVAAFANLLRPTNPCHEPLSATHAQSAEGPRGAGLAETTTPNRERLGVGVWWSGVGLPLTALPPRCALSGAV